MFTLAGQTFTEGDPISIDGSTGNIYAGLIPTVDATISGEFGKYKFPGPPQCPKISLLYQCRTSGNEIISCFSPPSDEFSQDLCRMVGEESSVLSSLHSAAADIFLEQGTKRFSCPCPSIDHWVFK